MLDAKLSAQLKAYLQNLKTEVQLHIALDVAAHPKKSNEISELANEIAQLSDLVKVVSQQDKHVRVPSMQVVSAAKNTSMTFAGVPLGHEFTSLVLALLHSGGHPLKLTSEQIEFIVGLEGQFEFETFVSLSCQTCPGVVQALNMMAALNPNIRHTMIDGSLFQDEVNQRNIMAVPSVYLNGEVFSQGGVTIDQVLKKIDPNSGKKQAEQLAQKAPFEMLIIGGGPAGAAAAIYTARKGLRTGVVADKFGGQVAETVGIENFISVKSTEGPKLVSGLEEHVRDYPVDIMTDNKAVKLTRVASALGNVIHVELANGATLTSQAVILATGARWREMKVPGEKEYRGKGVAYCPHCDGPLFKGKRVAVIGGGNSGIEAAIDLANIVEHVTVLEFDSKLRADKVLQDKASSMPNIDIILNAQTTEVVGDGERVNGLSYTDRTDGSSKQVTLAGIFVQIGLVPNSEWLKGDIELTNRGEIVVSQKGETSIPGVFAAGDVTTSPFKQIIIAMGDGATAALGAFDYLIRQTVPVKTAEKQEQAA